MLTFPLEREKNKQTNGVDLDELDINILVYQLELCKVTNDRKIISSRLNMEYYLVMQLKSS